MTSLNGVGFSKFYRKPGPSDVSFSPGDRSGELDRIGIPLGHEKKLDSYLPMA